MADLTAAQQDQVSQLRDYVSEPDDTNGWTDDRLMQYITLNTSDDGTADLYAAAASIWHVKAADVANLVDVSENGSSRKMSDVYKNAIAMSNSYRDRSDAVIAVADARPRTRAIVRP